MNPAERIHCDALERILFSTSGVHIPPWLAQSARKAQQRYAGIPLTGQFKAALAAFDLADSPKPFELFIVGEGKFGKSTMVNCLLGTEQSKVSGLPQTRFFLRYVPCEQPSRNARLYLRLRPGMHDWIEKQAGRGREVKDLFEITEHVVPVQLAEDLVTREMELLDRGGYEPAIFEVEIEVGRNGQTVFRDGIRIVDTQGLDQLFPAELYQSALHQNDSSTAGRFMAWMRQSARGMHLEWQFRRCDAVLWCIDARRIGSAATAAALDYFSGYSKKIVIALTRIDSARNDAARDKLIQGAKRHYSRYSDRIIAVNGLDAWKGVLNCDAGTIAGSGFIDIADALRTVCETEGAKVRNIALYTGLRQTERQYRQVLRSLQHDYRSLREKLQSDLQRIERACQRDKLTIGEAVSRIGLRTKQSVLDRIGTVEYRDGPAELAAKLRIDAEQIGFSSFIQSRLNNDIRGNVVGQAQITKDYVLPAFDADGNKAGSCYVIAVDVPLNTLSIAMPVFDFRLSEWFEAVRDWIDEKLGKIFRSKEADNRRAARLIELHAGIRKSFDSGWERHISHCLLEVDGEVERQYQALKKEILSKYSCIEKLIGDSVERAELRIELALQQVSVLPVLQAEMLAAMSGKRSNGRADASLAITLTIPSEKPIESQSHLDVEPVVHRDRYAGTPDYGFVKKVVQHRRFGKGVVQKMERKDYLVLFEGEDKARKFSGSTLRDPEFFLQ